MFATPRSIIPGQPEAEEIPEIEVTFLNFFWVGGGGWCHFLGAISLERVVVPSPK